MLGEKSIAYYLNEVSLNSETYFVSLRFKVLLLLVAALGYAPPQSCTQMGLIAEI